MSAIAQRYGAPLAACLEAWRQDIVDTPLAALPVFFDLDFAVEVVKRAGRADRTHASPDDARVRPVPWNPVDLL
ncbi:hypothetical protein SAMN05421504_102196 [Amycolatopsis xylanica]|uniref:Uncharacterized protein n=1 Tax=Amycolatopsis xylanica TaxID=589385 RepID=A0A1H2YNN9_9PSEU|nr:hypothetical protein [Amycolatopsis xylanica]SDX06605.1 hypothetical protein SAMN05421504_102196 [Amycolatopsis xylanica]